MSKPRTHTQASHLSPARWFTAPLMMAALAAPAACSGNGELTPGGDPPAAAAAAELPNVHVLFIVNTDHLKDDSFAPDEAATQAFVSEFNTVLKASQVATNDVLTWAGYAELEWPVSKDAQEDVLLARTRSEPYEEVWELRDAKQADVVVIYSPLGPATVGYTPTISLPLIVGGISSAYWVPDAALMRNNAFAFVNLRIAKDPERALEETLHEVGHLFGANHEPASVEEAKLLKHGFDFRAWATDAPHEENRAYVNPKAGFKTVMAYGSVCKTPPCTRDPLLFSNPDVVVKTRGEPFPAGTEEQNNAATMQQVIPIVAKYY